MGCQWAPYTSHPGALKMKIFVSLILILLPLVCDAAPKEPSCDGMIGRVSIEYKGIQRLNVWGRDTVFGTFAISNRSSKEMKLPLDGTYYPLIVHGQYVELQSRVVSGAWELDNVVLEEFLQPRKWLLLGNGEGALFFLEMAAPINDPLRIASSEYRVLLKDASGCEYLSSEFRISVK
jgi:hypothetical protein